jgi:hypothetical protein
LPVTGQTLLTEFRVTAGPPGTPQGTGKPLIKNVPGPVPFTLSGTWVVPGGGVRKLEARVRTAEGSPVLVLANDAWRNGFAYERDFGDELTAREEQTLLVLIEGDAELHFEKLIDGAVIATATIEIETSP